MRERIIERGEGGGGGREGGREGETNDTCIAKGTSDV